MSELTKAAEPVPHHVDESNKVDSVLVEAVPTLSFEVLSLTRGHGSFIIENVGFSWHKENFLISCLGDLVYVVEFLGLGKIVDVAGVQEELGLFGKSVDLVHDSFQGTDYVGIGRLIESHVAVADLYKAKLSHFVRVRPYTSKIPAVDSVIVMIVLDEPAGVRFEQVFFVIRVFLRLGNVVHHIRDQATQTATGQVVIQLASSPRRVTSA